MALRRRKRLSIDAYVEGILNGNRVVLSQAITLIESSLPEDHQLAQEVLEHVLPHTGKSIRIGITGVPGVGKSTFIEAMGKYVTAQSKKLAVLTIDPSSQRSKGSILGDKTRMEELAHDPLAYIRPSASGSALGGVSNRTRESMLLCEAAGYEVIFIETVGVGQSETAVHGMVDFFLLLMLAGAGDELQGIKKGIMEMADAIAITKSDGENLKNAQKARAEYARALHLFPPAPSGWFPPVLTCSALEKQGLENVWEQVGQFQERMTANGFFDQNRRQQNLNWMHENIRYTLEQQFYRNEKVKQRLPQLEEEVKSGQAGAMKAALELLQLAKEE